MSLKLVGYRFSPTVQEVLHVVEASGAPVELQDVHWDDEETRKTLYPKSPTGTLPYLETKEGVLSESKAIELYLAETYKPALLGEGDLQKAQVRQWMDFASFELGDCAQKIVYPLFGWKPYCKESADQANNRLKEFMKALDQQVKGKRYAFGEELTLADIALFNKLKFFFQLVFPKNMRDKVFPNVNDWFLRVLNTPETDKVYGKVLLCNQPLKPFIAEKKEEKPQEKGKKGNEGKDKKENAKKQEPEEVPEKPKKKQNPLDLLPPSKLELETFKRAFLNNKDKEDAMKKFWEVYDPEGYSLWRLEYDNLPTECKVLFRTSNSKGMFLQKCDNLRRYAFGEELTLADIALFNKLKFFFQLVFPKNLREKVFPNVNDWFLRVLNTPETDKVYGKVLLCNQPLKPFIQEKKEEKHQDKGKKGNEGKEGKEKKDNAKKQEQPEEVPEKPKKKQNPLDLLPPSKLELESFKRAFLNNKDKEDAMKKFWEIYDPEGYSLWRLEYDNLPTECKVLYRTSNSKGMFLQKCDNLRRYAFATHGVYGVEDDYKIRGLWMFRGLEVPQEMKDNDLYEYIHFRKLDHTNEEDRKLVHDYWTKLDENDEVEGRKCADVSYFN